MRLPLAIATLALVLITGCSGMSAAPGPTLAGTSWKLTGWAEAGTNPADFTLTARFADGRVTGKAAVNNYFAAYTEGPGNKLSLGDAGSTMMAGPPPAMQAEQTYLRLLGRVRSFSRADRALTLADSAGQMVLEFALAP